MCKYIIFHLKTLFSVLVLPYKMTLLYNYRWSQSLIRDIHLEHPSKNPHTYAKSPGLCIL